MSAFSILDDVRRRVAAGPHDLRVARERLDAVRMAGGCFPGALRTFPSGSLATKLVNDPVSDGDGGLVMDRRIDQALGPDGKNVMPSQLVECVRRHIARELLRGYPRATVERMKRGILVEFNEPLASGNDPTVDLVVALNRRDGEGLWIPNLDSGRWDASHPERHVELFTCGWDALRRTRQHVVRVVKAQVKQFEEPAICSFNIAALAWECIELHERLDLALYRFFDYASSELATGLTSDPAGVSESIRVADLDLAVRRLRQVADALALAIDAGDDDGKVREALSAFGVFWTLVDPPADGVSAVQHAIVGNRPLSVSSTGRLTAAAAASAALVKPTRSYGAAK